MRSPAMRQLVSVLARYARSDLPVLIRGESGSGKELAARWIHARSSRASGPFTVIDCGSMPAGLVDAELFGARAGSYTGLEEDREGALAQVGGGTVFVDEVTSVPGDVQGKLLRAVTKGRFRPLGAEEERGIDARFLFATAEDLDEEARQGRVREEFLHGIRVLTADVPPLRQRQEDLPDLVRLFLDAGGGRAVALGRGVIERLRKHSWPGNVRELRNVISGLCVENTRSISRGAVERRLSAESGAPRLFSRKLLEHGDLAELKRDLERDYLLFHLERLGGDTRALSEFLGISRVQLYRRCHRLAIRLSERRRRR